MNQPYLNTFYAKGGDGYLNLPIDLNYEIDLWGRIRRAVGQARAQAQASATDIETSRLSLRAELAMDYLNLRSVDAQRQLLGDTVKAYQASLQLTEDRYNGGASPLSDASQARTQLQVAQVQNTNVAIERAAYEHAIAAADRQGACNLSIASTADNGPCSHVAVHSRVLPSQLLAQRPDIASSERNVAAANEQIGIAEAALSHDFTREYFRLCSPLLLPNGSPGQVGSSPSDRVYREPTSTTEAAEQNPTLRARSTMPQLRPTGKMSLPHSNKSRTI